MQDTAPGPTLSAVTARPLQRRLLTQCVVLAGLLHIAVVVVFGNSPGGSAEPGEGLWGAIQVRLAGPPAPDSREAASLGQAATGPAGAAVRQRLGGSVRPDAAPQAPDTPGAAQAGRWLPQPADGDPEAPPFAPAELPARQAPDAPPALASPERPPALVAPALPAPPSPPATPAPPAAPAPPAVEAPPAPPPTVAPPVMPTVPAPGAGADAPRRAPVRQAASPPVLAPPALPEPAMPAMPEVPAFTTQAPLPPRALTPRNPTASVAPLQAQALTPTPPLAPPLPVVPVQAAPPPRQVAPRDPAAALPTLAPADLGATAPPSPPALPGFAVAAPAHTAVPTAQPPAGAGPAATTATTAAPATPAALTTPIAPGAGLAATPDGARRVAGTPEAGPRVGRDVATPPSQAASAARLNLDLVRPPRGGPLTAGSSSGLLSVVPHPPEQKSKLAQDIEGAAKADCRKAYSGMGLAAVLPLAMDALREKGCRW